MYNDPSRHYNPYEVSENSTEERQQYSNRVNRNPYNNMYNSNFENMAIKFHNSKIMFQHPQIHNEKYRVHPYWQPGRFSDSTVLPCLFNSPKYNKQIAFYSPSMGNPIIQLNNLLSNPTKENIMALFHQDGYLRLNMLYISPIAIKHFREKLQELGFVNWSFTDNELIFKLKTQIVSFRGTLKITYRDTKIFCLELDFDPIISDDSAVKFLKEIEVFLKNCDAVFFMTYTISIDSEILNYPLSESLSFLASRK